MLRLLTSYAYTASDRLLPAHQVVPLAEGALATRPSIDNAHTASDHVLPMLVNCASLERGPCHASLYR